jgi:hypothetical protein
LELVRKQLEGRKENGNCNQPDKQTKETGTKNCKNVQHYMEGGRHFPGLVADKAGRLGVV